MKVSAAPGAALRWVRVAGGSDEVDASVRRLWTGTEQEGPRGVVAAGRANRPILASAQ